MDTTTFPAGRMTLAAVLEAVGLPILDVVEAPRGLEVEVTGLVMYEPHEELPRGDGAALLLIGVAPLDAGTPSLLTEVGRLDYSAVIMKPHGAPLQMLSEAAHQADIALLSASLEVSWRELDGLLIAALGSGGISTQTGASRSVSELFDLVNSVARVIGGSVVIEDLEQRILAHSSVPNQRIDASRQASILNRRVPDLPWHREQYMKILKSPGPVRFEALRDELPRVAIAIRSGTIPLGTMWAIEGTLDDAVHDAEAALLEVAQIAAVHLLRHAARDEVHQHLGGDALAAVIDGSLSVDEAARRWSLLAGSEVSLLGFAPSAANLLSTSGLAHMSTALRRQLSALRPDAFCTGTNQTLYVLTPGSGGQVTVLAQRLAQALSAATGDTMRIASGDPTRDLTALPQIAEDVRDILSATAATADFVGDSVITFADARRHILLNRVAQILETKTRLRDPCIQGILDHDHRHGTQYAETLKVWLDCFGDWTRSAAVLNLHSNTVRYRVARIEEKYELDLSNPHTRLATWVELNSLPL